MVEKTGHGGARKGSGRPHTIGHGAQIKSLRLSKDHWDMAREIGDGNMSQGIRRALEAYRK